MSNELIPADNGQVPALPSGVKGDVSLMTSKRPRIITSLDSTKPEDRALLFRALALIDETGREGVNKTYNVVHFVMRDAQRRNMQTEQLEPCVMLTLVCEDGSTYGTTSEYTIESFHLLCTLSSYPPWKPARRLFLAPIKTRSNFEICKFFDAPEVKDKPKVKA